MKPFLLIIVMLISVLAPALIIAYVGSSAVKGLSRNPSAAPKIFIIMIMSFIFAAAITALVLIFVVSHLLS